MGEFHLERLERAQAALVVAIDLHLRVCPFIAQLHLRQLHYSGYMEGRGHVRIEFRQAGHRQMHKRRARCD